MIGFFDSGVGGLTVIRDVHKRLPEYGTVYLGDSARSPYGIKTHEEIVEYTWQGVEWLFRQGCPLVVLACNSASAQALRIIQQEKMDKYPEKKVLGVIRPTAEVLSKKQYKTIAVFSTPTTKKSGSYIREFYDQDRNIIIKSFDFPDWVPLVESGKCSGLKADRVVKKDIIKIFNDLKDVDAVLLACTHYPALFNFIKKYIPKKVDLFEQGPLVANSLVNYLKRHPEIEDQLKKNQKRKYFVTGDVKTANHVLKQITGQQIDFEQVDLRQETS